MVQYQDSTYSWVVLAAACGMELLYASGVGTIGVLIVQLTETFNVPKSALTWMGGLLLFSGFILGFIPSALARRYGVRPVGIAASLLACGSCVATSLAPDVNLLYLTHGVLASIAFCTFFNLASISGQQYFQKRRALASGVTMAAISGGLLLWPPSCTLLIEAYGWRGAFLIMAGIQLHGAVFAAVIRPVPSSTGKEDKNVAVTGGVEENKSGAGVEMQAVVERGRCEAAVSTGDSPTVQVDSRKGPCTGVLAMIRTACSPVSTSPRYLGYLLGIFLIQTGHITAISMLPLRARALGLNKTLGASLVSILGGTGGVARAAFGFVGDWSKVNRTLVVGASGLVSGILTCVMGYMTTYTQLAALTALLGVTSAAYNALQGACVIDHVGRQLLAPGVGLLSVSMGFGRLSALLISGIVLDLLGDPRFVFVLFGLVEAGGGIIMPGVVLLQKRQQFKKGAEEQQAEETEGENRGEQVRETIIEGKIGQGEVKR